MAVLGILTCQILELEFAHLLACDRDIDHITVLEDQHSSGFLEALAKEGFFPSRIPLMRGFTANGTDRMEVLVRVLELALHYRKRTLQEGVFKAAKEMARHVDAILLGYGLCGNALENPEQFFSDIGVPVLIPMDQDHPVDDCVGLIIGGRENYYGEQCRIAGTFFMIPGWTRHWQKLFIKEYGELNVEMVRRIFGMSGYERSLLISDPALNEGEMRKNILEFNRLFGFRTEARAGTLEMLNKAWDTAKSLLRSSSRREMSGIP